MLKIIDKFTKT